jgi:holo-[acyl-carrier protein] synthase
MKIGIDLVHIPEIEHAIKKRSRFATRFFSEEEIKYCESKPNPAQHYAARFAAKEAYIKATGYNGRWKTLEVLAIPDLPPIIRTLTEDQRQRSISLSLTHSGNYAAAVILAEDTQEN